MKFFYICLFSFVFIATSSFAFRQREISFLPKQEVAGITVNSEEQFTIEPVLSENASFPILSAQAVLAIDVGSGKSLYEKNPDKPFLPASTTKIITALVAMDYYSDEAVLEVKNPEIEGQKMGLVSGENIKTQDLLYGLLVSSANDAAEVLAQNFPGGRDYFITMMNLKARSLDLKNSNFVNPTGLDSNGDNVYSTASDLIKVSIFAMQDPRFAKIVGTKQITVTSLDGKIIHKLVNINELLGSVEGVEGIKTGWTESARENLVTYIKRGDRKLVIVLLGSQDRFGETRELIDWIFANYHWEEVPKPI